MFSAVSRSIAASSSVAPLYASIAFSICDVEGMDVVQDALRLGPLGGDRRRLGRDRTGSQPGDRKGENHEGCLSYAGARGDTPHHSRQAHREGPVRHGSTTLASLADTGNREPG